jgi:hypothetical protein
MKPTFDDLEFVREGYRIAGSDVPMSACEVCGERSVPGPIGVELGDVVAELVEQIERLLAERDVVSASSFRFRASERLSALAPTYS